MGKLCLLCKYERQPEDGAPEGECPSCGALYANVEAQRKAASAAANARALASARTRRSERKSGADGFILFRTMVTPWLSVALFVLVLVTGGIVLVYGLMEGSATLILAAVGGIFWTRIFLEAIMVFFRIAEDVSASRDLLADIYEQQIRNGTKD